MDVDEPGRQGQAIEIHDDRAGTVEVGANGLDPVPCDGDVTGDGRATRAIVDRRVSKHGSLRGGLLADSGNDAGGAQDERASVERAGVGHAAARSILLAFHSHLNGEIGRDPLVKRRGILVGLGQS